MPIRNYWGPVKARRGVYEKYNEWIDLNTGLHEIAEQVDIIFPSLYTFYDDREGWKIYAEEMLKEAKKNNKPIYVYLCPQYHGSNRFRGWDFLEGEYWKIQLEMVYKYADGVVIWSRKLNAKDWDKDRAWWQETIKFIDRISYIESPEKEKYNISN